MTMAPMKGLISWIWTVIKREAKDALPPILAKTLNQMRDHKKPDKNPNTAIRKKDS
jgi:hypothetical protein